jgi:MFS family permease
VSATGSWAQAVALGWVVLELGNSAFLLGLTNFASMIPLLIFSFPFGAIVDNYSRRNLLLMAQVALGLSWAILAVAAVFGFLTIPLILVLSVVGGLSNALGWPTWSVFIKDLVGPEKLRVAVSLNSARFNLTRVIGPAIAGIILARWGAAACLVVAAVSIVPVIVTLLMIPPKPVMKTVGRAWLPALGEGLQYAWREPAVRDLLILTAVLGFFALPYQTFLPAFARDVLGSGPEGLGFLLTAVGFGALAGAVFSGSRISVRRPVAVLAVTAIITPAALAVTAYSRSLEFAVVWLAIVGLSSTAYLAIANATVQLATRDDLVGRVMGLWTVVVAGFTPLGSLVMGAAAEAFGLTIALAGAGVASIAVSAVILRRWAVRPTVVVP